MATENIQIAAAVGVPTVIKTWQRASNYYLIEFWHDCPPYSWVYDLVGPNLFETYFTGNQIKTAELTEEVLAWAQNHIANA